jgi:hypothetical protein
LGLAANNWLRILVLFSREVAAEKSCFNVAVSPDVRCVLPILVVQDLVLRTPFINYFLNQRFQAELAHYAVRGDMEVLPLTVVQITHLEDLVEMAEAVDLDVLDFLRKRCRRRASIYSDLKRDGTSVAPEDSRWAEYSSDIIPGHESPSENAQYLALRWSAPRSHTYFQCQASAVIPDGNVTAAGRECA